MFAMMSVRMGREEGRGGRNVLKKEKRATEEGTREREREREMRMLLDLGDLDKR